MLLTRPKIMKTETIKHTPGPWQITHLRRGIEQINMFRIGGPVTHEHNEYCSAIFQSYDEHDEHNDANAKLISAAPELLEALQLAEATINRLAVQHGPFNSSQGTLDVIKAAITKATT